ncbi:MAG: hypothetical protein V3S51_02200, partial [Dehalococcoidia bacterium]
PKVVSDWSLRNIQVKLIKMGGRIVRHAGQIGSQLAEVAVSRGLFAAVLERVVLLCGHLAKRRQAKWMTR